MAWHLTYEYNKLAIRIWLSLGISTRVSNLARWVTANVVGH